MGYTVGRPDLRRWLRLCDNDDNDYELFFAVKQELRIALACTAMLPVSGAVAMLWGKLILIFLFFINNQTNQSNISRVNKKVKVIVISEHY